MLTSSALLGSCAVSREGRYELPLSGPAPNLNRQGENKMGWMDKVGGLLKQYTSGSGAAAAPAPDVHAHFDQVAEAAPPSALAEGLSAAFKSDQTPAFGQMLSTLFNNSSGEQKAGIINQIMSSVPPGTLTSL